MALFGGSRDISLFRTLNRELINGLVDTEVDIFKTSIYDVDDNLYGEAINKIYKHGIRAHCLITHDDQEWDASEFGMDVNQSTTFSFLRDDLLPPGAIGIPAANVVLEVGDIIWWNNIYWEIDSTNENQFIVGKNPDHDLGNKREILDTSGNSSMYISASDAGIPQDSQEDFGSSFSIICTTHQTRKSKVQFENIREGYKLGLYNE
jgi:hypothetical protein